MEERVEESGRKTMIARDGERESMSEIVTWLAADINDGHKQLKSYVHRPFGSIHCSVDPRLTIHVRKVYPRLNPWPRWSMAQHLDPRHVNQRLSISVRGKKVSVDLKAQARSDQRLRLDRNDLIDPRLLNPQIDSRNSFLQRLPYKKIRSFVRYCTICLRTTW